MLASEVDYDVYIAPRIGPIQFGDFVAAEAVNENRFLETPNMFAGLTAPEHGSRATIL